MKLLIYGAGVIGCLYAALFSESGYDTTIYARGNRLKNLEANGLQYKKGNLLKTANVKIISKLADNDRYDFIFLTVRENQLHNALMELGKNVSPTIVTMVNSLENYNLWEKYCRKGRIIPAFPGAGGSFDGEILNAELTPRLIQPTTFAEIDGQRSKRINLLANIFKNSNIPYQIVCDMHVWQLCHLAMVVPLADAYYEAKDPVYVGHEWTVVKKTAIQIKRNYRRLHQLGYDISPHKNNLFLYMPTFVLALGLRFVFLSKFGNKFMYQHSMKAPDEMHELHRQFYSYLKSKTPC